MVKVLRENNEIKETVLEYIKGATLLSAEEANNLLTQEERTIGYDWWLRTPGSDHAVNSMLTVMEMFVMIMLVLSPIFM